jgi:hypothetical protein
VSECKILTREEEQAQAKAMLHRGGYASGGRLRQEEKRDDLKDKRTIKKAVRQHESHDHPGKPKTDLKLKRGGVAAGRAPEPRMDRRARGGAMTEKQRGHGSPKGGKGVNVNIISPGAAQDEKKQAAQAGMQAGVRMGAAAASRPKPAMAPPPPGAGGGGMPPGGGAPPAAMPPPDPGQPPMKRGGRAK